MGGNFLCHLLFQYFPILFNKKAVINLKRLGINSLDAVRKSTASDFMLHDI